MIVVTAMVCCVLSTAFAQQRLTLHFKNKIGDDVLGLGKLH